MDVDDGDHHHILSRSRIRKAHSYVNANFDTYCLTLKKLIFFSSDFAFVFFASNSDGNVESNNDVGSGCFDFDLFSYWA